MARALSTLVVLLLAGAPVAGQDPPPGAAAPEILVSAEVQREGPGGWVILEGYAIVEFGGGTLQADRIDYNRVTGELLAEGNVVTRSGSTVLVGSRLEYDLRSGTGLIHDAEGWMDQDIHFTGKLVEKLSEDLYRLTDGDITSCSQPLPIWRISWSKALIREEGMAQMWNTTVRFKRMPSAYAPYIAFPVKNKRTSGFLVPQISTSSRRGVSADVAYFWAISRNMDATFEAEWFEKTGYILSPEFRYVLGPDAGGDFQGAYAYEDEEGFTSRRIALAYDHDQRFANGYHWIVDVDYTSDLTFSRDYATGIDESTRRTIWEKTRLVKTYPLGTLTFRGEDIRRPIGTQTQHSTLLPEAEFVFPSRKLGRSPVYLSFRGGVSAIRNKRQYAHPDWGGFSDDPTYGRLYVAPEFRIPLVQAPWMDLVPTIKLRENLYSSRFKEEGPEPEIEDELLDIHASELSLEMSGPRFERFYGLARGPGGTKWKHLIEPRINYRYIPDIANAEWVLPFDSLVDSFPRQMHPDVPGRDVDTNVLSYGITMRLLSKGIVEEDAPEPSAREVVSWTLGQNYSFNTYLASGTIGGEMKRRRFSDVTSSLWYRPTESVSFNVTTTLDQLTDDPERWGLATKLSWGDWGERACSATQPGPGGCVDLRYNLSRVVGGMGARSESARLTTKFGLYHGRVALRFDVAYDLERSYMQNAVYEINYHNQCSGVRLYYSTMKSLTGPSNDELQFSIGLRNLGHFIKFRTRR
jgi:hypothetical protein